MRDSKLTWLANGLIAVILVLLPFHALLTTWAGSNFGHLDLFRIWKELLMVPLGLISLWVMLRNPTVKKQVLRSWLFWLVLAYVILTIGLGFWARSRGQVNNSAAIYGFLANVRFVSLLIFAWIISLKYSWLYDHWRHLILLPAAVVIIFGLMQWLVLPAGFLAHFGYGPHTIPAIQTVDQQAGYRRLQSTLRGANPLGAYLVLIITILTALVIDDGKRRQSNSLTAGAATILMFLTYSRSAYLGLLISLAVLGWLLLPRVLPGRPWRKWLSAIVVIVVLLGSISIFALRHNAQVENVVFHSSNQSRAATSSNAVRTSNLENGLKDVEHQPLGRGPGTAGPASTRNNNRARIAENYYIQIAQEVGLIGLGLFAAINIIVAWQLWRRQNNILAVILLASLVGLSFVNLVSHAWADDTLGLLWWGLAGVALAQPAHGSAILNKRQTHGKNSNQKAS